MKRIYRFFGRLLPVLGKVKPDPDPEEEGDESMDSEEEDEIEEPERFNYYPGTEGFIDPRETLIQDPVGIEEPEPEEELPLQGTFWDSQNELWERIPDPGPKMPRATRDSRERYRTQSFRYISAFQYLSKRKGRGVRPGKRKAPSD